MITETRMRGCGSTEVIITQVSKISSKQVLMKIQCFGIWLRMNETASVPLKETPSVEMPQALLGGME